MTEPSALAADTPAGVADGVVGDMGVLEQDTPATVIATKATKITCLFNFNSPFCPSADT
jgi:hypothetical protein